MNDKLIKKMTKQELLSLKEGEVFYHVNPYGVAAGVVPHIEHITLTSNWGKYKSDNFYLNNLLSAEVLEKWFSEMFGVREHETTLFLNDTISEWKGNFLNKSDAEDFAQFCSKDFETINHVDDHHSWCSKHLDYDF